MYDYQKHRHTIPGNLDNLHSIFNRFTMAPYSEIKPTIEYVMKDCYGDSWSNLACIDYLEEIGVLYQDRNAKVEVTQLTPLMPGPNCGKCFEWVLKGIIKDMLNHKFQFLLRCKSMNTLFPCNQCDHLYWDTMSVENGGYIECKLGCNIGNPKCACFKHWETGQTKPEIK